MPPPRPAPPPPSSLPPILDRLTVHTSFTSHLLLSAFLTPITSPACVCVRVCVCVCVSLIHLSLTPIDPCLTRLPLSLSGCGLAGVGRMARLYPPLHGYSPPSLPSLCFSTSFSFQKIWFAAAVACHSWRFQDFSAFAVRSPRRRRVSCSYPNEDVPPGVQLIERLPFVLFRFRSVGLHNLFDEMDDVKLYERATKC